jgi:formylglycine-generating enzyme required for sulfatase activity
VREDDGARPDAPARASLTRQGAVMGTPYYMPPEAWSGEAATRRWDVYSLGAVLFELAAGRPPHNDVPLLELSAIVTERDAPPLASVARDIEPRFAEIVDRCLRRDPSDRYASADELSDALERLVPVSAAEPPQGNPYRGLQTFEAEHRALFFGRRTEIAAVIDRLRTESFVLVAGDSGTGKSSLCRAGVLPRIVDGALAGDRAWTVEQMVPGRHPLARLAAALGGTPPSADDVNAFVRDRARQLGRDTGLIIFVDQLEELVTVSDPDEAAIVAQLIGELADHVPGVRVLATARGDFLTRLATLPSIGGELSSNLYILPALGADGIREAIVEPARICGVEFESDELVDSLVAAASRPGELPLLQFALAELWQTRDADSATLTRAALDSIGGVGGALARHADRVFEVILPEDRALARRILLALITAEGTRARRGEADLGATTPAARRVLRELVQGRLLVARQAESGTDYEIAHEALIAGWGTLRGWIQREGDVRLLRERVGAAAANWERLGRPREVLWSGTQLAEAARLPADDLPERDARFLELSHLAVRRRRWGRRAAIAAIPLLALAVYAAITIRSDQARQRTLAAAARELDAKVTERLGAGSDALQRARSHDRDVVALRERAFDAFDARDSAQGEELWSRALDESVRVDREYATASQLLEAALMLDLRRGEVQALLADSLYERALLAERDQRVGPAEEFLQRLRLYDEDGHRAASWAAPAKVRIQTTPPGATITLEHADQPPKLLGSVPLDVELPAGSQTLIASAAGRPEVRYPILVGRGETLEVEIPLPDTTAIPDGFVFIPPGRFLFGTSRDEGQRKGFFSTTPLHTVTTSAYLIGRHEVTFAEWLAYLESLGPVERAERTPVVGAAGFHGALELRRLPAGEWQLRIEPTEKASIVYSARAGEKIRYADRDRRAAQDWLRFPVTGVRWEDAVAYASWLSSTGRVPGARLCSEHEWERAARGADSREFPHGDSLAHDDANFDATYGRKPLAFGVDEVGSHPASRSPFGLDDMSGNAWEWVSSSLVDDEVVLRSGSYYYARNTSRVVNRQIPERSFRNAGVGLRICADGP